MPRAASICLPSLRASGTKMGLHFITRERSHVDKYELRDPALRRMAAIIRGADLPLEEDRPPESTGVLAIFDGIRDGTATDQERLERGCVVSDALYIYCRAGVRGAT